MNSPNQASAIAWEQMTAGADDQLSYCERTVEAVLKELNAAKATLTEIEALPQPHCEMTQYRRMQAEWLAHRAICEAQAVQDARSAIKKASQECQGK